MNALSIFTWFLIEALGTFKDLYSSLQLPPVKTNTMVRYTQVHYNQSLLVFLLEESWCVSYIRKCVTNSSGLTVTNNRNLLFAFKHVRVCFLKTGFPAKDS